MNEYNSKANICLSIWIQLKSKQIYGCQSTFIYLYITTINIEIYFINTYIQKCKHNIIVDIDLRAHFTFELQHDWLILRLI